MNLAKLKDLDYYLIIIPLILIVLGIALIFSLVFSSQDAVLVLKQSVFAFSGLSLLLIISFIDYRTWRSIWWIIYLISVVLLILVEVLGFVAGGAMRWIDLGFFQLQPSEIAKIAIVLSSAFFFSGKIGKLETKDIVWSTVALLLPLGLILIEPDLGTALVLVFVYLVMLFVSRPNARQLIVIVAVISTGAIIFLLAMINIQPIGKLLKNYQRERIMTFFKPELDPYGDSYNVRQAQITIGSGGLTGKGLGRGSQSQLKFLPKPHTDFIFAGASEAMGFLGAGLIIILYFILIQRIIKISSIATDGFGMLVSLGIAMIIIFQVVVNIGMNLGLAPVTGIPLPFMSYGGTSMTVSCVSLGIVQSICIRRKRISY